MWVEVAVVVSHRFEVAVWLLQEESSSLPPELHQVSHSDGAFFPFLPLRTLDPCPAASSTCHLELTLQLSHSKLQRIALQNL